MPPSLAHSPASTRRGGMGAISCCLGAAQAAQQTSTKAARGMGSPVAQDLANRAAALCYAPSLEDLLAPDDTRVPPDAAVQEERAVPEAGAPPADADAQKTKLATLEAQLEESFKRARETGDRLKETHERLLRTAAEFDNFKKRAQKEKED